MCIIIYLRQYLRYSLQLTLKQVHTCSFVIEILSAYCQFLFVLQTGNATRKKQLKLSLYHDHHQIFQSRTWASVLYCKIIYLFFLQVNQLVTLLIYHTYLAENITFLNKQVKRPLELINIYKPVSRQAEISGISSSIKMKRWLILQ